MKRFTAVLLSLSILLAFAACGKKPAAGNSQGKPAQSSSSAPAGASTDEKKLGESVSYHADGEYLYLRIKTSYEFDAHDAYLDIVNPGFYLTRDSEFITRALLNDRCKEGPDRLEDGLLECQVPQA